MTADNSAYAYYKLGGSLEYQHPTYIVRQADKILYRSLKAGEFCYVLNSRQMGKSSLRVQMMKRLREEGLQCAAIDMMRMGSHVTETEWYGGIVSELIRVLSLSQTVDFSSWWSQRELLSPIQRLSVFIEDVLLIESPQGIVIFIDEIDSILKFSFKNDFFAFIRSCYDKRAENSEYQRLSFVFLGVTTPSDLIADRNRTPFNIGRAIALEGFQLHEAEPLLPGLQAKADDPKAVLQAILSWTGGQPFLTQKLCSLVSTLDGFIAAGQEFEQVEAVVRSRILNNWDNQDEPEHLRTIRDRLLGDETERSIQLLALYRQILLNGSIPQDGSTIQTLLRLSGVAVKQDDTLRPYNRIYQTIFDLAWVEQQLMERGCELANGNGI
jgi:AAA-like domain